MLVRKESRVVVTPLQPTRLDASARAEVDGDSVRLSLDGRNLGWGAHNLNVRGRVFHEDGGQQVYSWPLGRLEALAEFDFIEAIPLDEGVSEAPVQAIVVELDWGAGRTMLQAWPIPKEVPFYSHRIFSFRNWCNGWRSGFMGGYSYFATRCAHEWLVGSRVCAFCLSCSSCWLRCPVPAQIICRVGDILCLSLQNSRVWLMRTWNFSRQP